MVHGTVKHGQKGQQTKGNVNPDPHNKSEDPGLPSTTHGDLPAASTLSLSKSKAVRINLKPKISIRKNIFSAQQHGFTHKNLALLKPLRI